MVKSGAFSISCKPRYLEFRVSSQPGREFSRLKDGYHNANWEICLKVRTAQPALGCLTVSSRWLGKQVDSEPRWSRGKDARPHQSYRYYRVAMTQPLTPFDERSLRAWLYRQLAQGIAPVAVFVFGSNGGAGDEMNQGFLKVDPGSFSSTQKL